MHQIVMKNRDANEKNDEDDGYAGDMNGDDGKDVGNKNDPVRDVGHKNDHVHYTCGILSDDITGHAGCNKNDEADDEDIGDTLDNVDDKDAAAAAVDKSQSCGEHLIVRAERNRMPCGTKREAECNDDAVDDADSRSYRRKRAEQNLLNVLS